MLSVDDIETIRRAYYVEQKSIRTIAQEQRHHRRVVREAIRGASPPRRYRSPQARARPLLDPVVPTINQWLETDRDAPRKQRHTAKRIYDGFVGAC